VVWNDEHRHAVADLFSQHIDKAVYFRFKARRNVMYGC
jgi:hypothetical protein